jgi:hypothetical protein
MQSAGIHTIVEEIITLDPNLKGQKEILRGMVAEITAVRPRSEIDPAFRTGLRARLMLAKPVRSPFSSFLWYAFRFAPIGAVALLALTLTQPSAPYIEPISPTHTEVSPTAPSLRYEAGETVTAPQSVGGRETDTLTQTESTMSLKQAAPLPEFPIKIEPQPEGVFVQVASITAPTSVFIVIIASYPSGDQVIGASPLVSQGTTENVPIYLKVKVIAEGAYRAEVYTDNGDRIFVREEDALLTDAFGNPWAVPLIIFK